MDFVTDVLIKVHGMIVNLAQSIKTLFLKTVSHVQKKKSLFFRTLVACLYMCVSTLGLKIAQK